MRDEQFLPILAANFISPCSCSDRPGILVSMAGNSIADRKFVRKFVQFSVEVKIVSSAAVKGGADLHKFEARNFSVGGIGFVCPMELARGDLLKLKFILPGEKRTLILDGTVRSAVPCGPAEPAGFQIGVKFFNISPGDLAYMTNYMTGTFLLY